MKYLCDSCSRLVELEHFEVENSALAATCPACGATTRSAVPASPPSPKAPSLPESPRPPPVASSPPAAERADEVGLPADLEQQWKALLGNWHDVEAHRRLVQIAGLRDALAEVGRRYRVRAEAGDAMATQGRDDVVRHAITIAMAQSPVERRATRGVAAIVVALIVIGGLLCSMLLWKALG